MAEEAKKEQQVPEFPYRAASPEFFFLLQRIDRLDEKLSGQIAALRQEVREEIAALRRETSGTRTLIWTTFGLMLGALALVGTVLGIIVSISR